MLAFAVHPVIRSPTGTMIVPGAMIAIPHRQAHKERDHKRIYIRILNSGRALPAFLAVKAV